MDFESVNLKLKWKRVKHYLKINTLLNSTTIDTKLLDNNDSVLTQAILFGSGSLILSNNPKLITTLIENTSLTERFDDSLL